MNELKIKNTPPPNPRAVNKALLEELFLSGKALPEIAETLDVQIATIRRHLGKLGLLYRHERGPRNDNHKQKPILYAVKDEVLPVIIDRDPCGFCGVRGDIGCRHNRRAA